MDIVPYLKIIGTNIKRLRGNMKQRDLAEKAGISRSTLSNIENGKSIELANMLRIAMVFDISPADLFLTNEDRQEISYKIKLIVKGIFSTMYPGKK